MTDLIPFLQAAFELYASLDAMISLFAARRLNLNFPALSFVIYNVFKDSDKPFLMVFDDKEEAAFHLNDLEQLCGKDDVLFYPGSYRRPYQIEETDNVQCNTQCCSNK